MRTVFRHDGGSENRKTVRWCGCPESSDWNNASLRNTVRRVACFKAIAPPPSLPVANFVIAYAAVSDRSTENGLPPFTRLPRKRKISEIIDRRLTNGKWSMRYNERPPFDVTSRYIYTGCNSEFTLFSLQSS